MNDLGFLRILDKSFVENYLKSYLNNKELIEKYDSKFKMEKRVKTSYALVLGERYKYMVNNFDYIELNNRKFVNFHRVIHRARHFKLIQACNSSMTVDFYYTKGTYKLEVLDLRFCDIGSVYTTDKVKIHQKFLLWISKQGCDSESPLKNHLKRVFLYSSNLSKEILDELKLNYALEHIFFSEIKDINYRKNL